MLKEKKRKIEILDYNYSYSYLRNILINLVAISTTIGITFQIQIDSFFGFYFFILLFTLLETMIGLLIKLYFMKQIYMSFGLLIFLEELLLIWITGSLIPDLVFKSTFGLLFFTFIFVVLRFFMMYYLDRFLKSTQRK